MSMIVIVSCLLWDMDRFGSPSEVISYRRDLASDIMNEYLITIVNMILNYIWRVITPGNGKFDILLS